VRSSEINITFPSGWIDGQKFDQYINMSAWLHNEPVSKITFNFGNGCKVMVDAAVRILSLANQLISCGKNIYLVFADGQSGTMGYLDRVGFFDLLDPSIKTNPDRPSVSSATLHKDTNQNLVEIARINPKARDNSLPSRLSERLTNARSGSNDGQLSNATYTVFAELIDNIYQHAATSVDGYAALQVYRNGNSAKVVVCDSGAGILETLRPAITSERIQKLNDIDLIIHILNDGLSRFGPSRGCGLKTSASHAIKYNADLEIRLPKSLLKLVPSRQVYEKNTAHYSDNLSLIWGTHICFSFLLN